MSPSTQLSSARLSGVFLMTAAVLGMVGNAMHPHSVDTDPVATLRGIADSSTWVWIHAAIITAILLLMAGIVGFVRELELTRAAPLARVAGTASLVGGAFACVSTSIDGFGRKAVALNWVVAPKDQADAALQTAIGVGLFDGAVWTIGILVFFGAAFICLGAAMSASGNYVPAFGWIAIAAGLLSVVAAAFRIAASGDEPTSETLFLVSSVVITIWAFVLGVMLLRTDAPMRSPAVAKVSVPR